MIRRYITWRNNHVYDERLRQVIARANQRKRSCVKRRRVVPALICDAGSYLGVLLRLVLVRAGCRGRAVLGT